MRLVELHIYGYGKIENKRFNLENVQLIYGENEAGKSTIMSFIHSILFGFPTKQQSQLRLEPKTSSEYGGKMICEVVGHGMVTIERIKGKASGDVTVSFEDGRIEGEETLQELVGRMDKTTYQNIFSFNLEGLQNIHRLKKEELNRYLFSAGSTGTDLLLQLEQHWQKERERLFKKSGRKPFINQALNELKSLEKQVKEAKGKNEQYIPLLKEQNSLESLIVSLETEKEEKIQEKNGLQSALEHWGTLQEYNRITEQLAETSEMDFPAKGLERFNELKTEERQVSAYLETLLSKQKSLKEKLENESVDPILLEGTPLIENLLSQQPLYMKWKDEESELSRESKTIRTKINETVRELNLQVEVEDLPAFNTSLMMFERIQQTIEKKSKLKYERENMTSNIHSVREEIQRTEEKCESIETRLLIEDEYQALQKSVKDQSANQVSLEQVKWVETQVGEVEQNYTRKKKSFSQQLIFTGVIFLLLLMGSIWSLLTDNVMVTILSVVILFAVVFITFQARMSVKTEFESLQKLREKAQELKGSGRTNESNYEVDKLHQTLKSQMELRQEWKQRILGLEEQQEKLERLLQQNEEIQKKIQLENQQIEEIKKELYLPSEFHWKWLRDGFNKIKEIIDLHEKSKSIHEDTLFIQKKMTQYTNECKSFLQKHSLPFHTVDEAFIQLKNILLDLEKKQLNCTQMLSDLKPLTLEIDQATIQLKKINEEYFSLYKIAQCENEAEFRQKALWVEERNALLTKYEGMKTGVNQGMLTLFSTYKEKGNIEKELTIVSDHLQKITIQLANEQKKLASVSYEIKVLEDGNNYSAILQQFEAKKAELEDLTHDWSVYTLAQTSMLRTMEHYHTTKMPKVMELAEEHFKVLTQGLYHRIFLSDDEMIEVQRKDLSRFQAVELSQGTKEQLYISIRFALIQSLRKTYQLPLLIDDGAVNFDQERTDAFLKLLKKMGEDYQILFFTCHEHIMNKFSDNQRIVLEREEKSII
ncbi:ATP-binding protein [Rossellomorea aquimaris]|uniref:ATP-binding protein n=1 Tax=Rossellomorea aquimaris TaxID=189382 RepID=UPI0007D05279|nr:AAA family ATPase [Rossellomorea aquimaris]